jgi:hypothetical protein
MLALTAPQVKKINNSMCRKYSLESPLLNRCNTIIEKCLSGNNHLTRAEIVQELGRQGIETDELRATLIVMNAELDGIICNGGRQGKQITYALIEERIPPASPLTKEEALAQLAQRYFTSHCPATLYDFAWWSGLKLTEARQALELIKPNFHVEEIDGQTYWFDPALTPDNNDSESIFFLPAFDEFMVSYKDRTASLNPSIAKTTITGNGIFKPIIVIEGKVVGTWKRTFKKDKVLIETHYFYPPNNLQELAVKEAAMQYGNFMQMEIEMK